MLKSDRLSILSEWEVFAFYGLPDFDDAQSCTYFAFEDKEWDLISKRPSFHAQVTCAIQIGYFKAKKIFFRFSLNKIPKDDLHFILLRYFPGQALEALSITFSVKPLLNYLDIGFGLRLFFPRFTVAPN